MEELIGIVAWIIFVFISVARHLAKTNEDKTFQRKSIDEKIEDLFQEEVTETFLEDNLVKVEEQQQVSQLSTSPDQEFKLAKETGKTKEKKSKAKENYYPLSAELTMEKAIIQGVIFKEILGPPRAKKPYQYHHNYR